jgi:DNA-binding Lrp family transcriptional regulator
MTREQLVKTVQRLLRTDGDLDFLLKLDQREMETLVAVIRHRVDQTGIGDQEGGK